MYKMYKKPTLRLPHAVATPHGKNFEDKSVKLELIKKGFDLQDILFIQYKSISNI